MLPAYRICQGFRLLHFNFIKVHTTARGSSCMKRKMPPEHHTGAQRNAQVSNCNCTSVVCSGFASATGAWEGLTYRKIFRRKAIQQEVAALLQHLLPASPFPQRTPLRRQHVQSDLQVMIPPQLQPNLHTMSSIRCIDNKHNHMTLPHRIQVPWRCRSSFSQGLSLIHI